MRTGILGKADNQDEPIGGSHGQGADHLIGKIDPEADHPVGETVPEVDLLVGGPARMTGLEVITDHGDIRKTSTIETLTFPGDIRKTSTAETLTFPGDLQTIPGGNTNREHQLRKSAQEFLRPMMLTCPC